MRETMERPSPAPWPGLRENRSNTRARIPGARQAAVLDVQFTASGSRANTRELAFSGVCRTALLMRFAAG